MKQIARKILMVDDDEDDYFLTRQMLSEAKYIEYTLDWASTYEEGWTMIQSGEYDAVLMDYDLGPQNGLDLIRRAVSSDCRFPIILFTGRGSYEVDLQAMQAGAALYLTKDEVNPLLLERGIRYAIERKQNEQALSAVNEALSKANALLSEQKAELDRRYQDRSHLLESIQDGFFSIDRDWRITYINRRAARNGGREPKEIIGKNFWKAFPKIKGTDIERHYCRAMIERTPLQFETPGVYRDAVYNVNIYPSAEGISVFVQDISERKRAEQALEHSRQEQVRLASFPELNPNPILEIDLSGKIHYINPHGQALFPDLMQKVTEHAYLAGWNEIVSRVRQEPSTPWVREIQVEDHVYQQSIFFYKEYQLIRIYGMDISIRIQALNALSESESQQRELAQSLALDRSRLEAVLANLPVGVWIADETGRMIDKNQQADLIWAGKAPLAESFDQYHQYSAWEPESGKSPAPDEFPMAVAQRTGRPVGPVEYNIRRFDGTEGTILASAAPIKDPQGVVTGTVGINVDITERKQVELASQASEEKYRKLFDNISESFVLFEVVADTDGNPIDFRYAEVNQAFETAVGLPQEQILNHTLLAVFPGTVPDIFQCLKRVAATGQPELVELFNPTVEKWFEEYVFAPFPGYVAALIKDITRRKQMDESLRLSEERFSKAFAATPSALVISRMADGQIEQINDAFIRLFGYSEQEVLGKTSLQLNMFAEPATRKELVEKILAAQAVRGAEVDIRVKSGEIRQAKVNIESLRIKDEDYVLTAIEDITARKRAGTELER